MVYESAIAYDAVHAGRGKVYAAEAAKVTALIRAAVPNADSLLDLGCGSGRHLVHFLPEFRTVTGLDLSPVMLDMAAGRAPGATFVQGDMADFDVGRRFDAVVCLFSSLGYLRDTGQLRSAASAIARHLTAAGIALIEPWFTAEQFGAGRVSLDSGELDGWTVARITRSSITDGRAVLLMDYLVADAVRTQYISERHEMTLFAHDDYLDALRAAGLSADLDIDGGPVGRGRITARPVAGRFRLS